MIFSGPSFQPPSPETWWGGKKNCENTLGSKTFNKKKPEINFLYLHYSEDISDHISNNKDV